MASLLQDSGSIMIGDSIDIGSLCIAERVDSKRLCTHIGDVTAQQRYRADTTLLTADNTSLTADYSL